MYLETLQYYRNCGSNVFSCLLDTSKAFDRVHYGKLFNILLSKKLPICIIRMLLDCYIHQETRASLSFIPIILQCPMGLNKGNTICNIVYAIP